MKTRLLFVLVTIVAMGSAVLVAPAQQSDAPRYALLIGNSNYPDAPSPLVQPPKNVRALADELRRGGFEVDVKENLGREEMQRAIDAFKAKIRPGSTALFFFSGYGLQANRQSFIIPLNAQVWSENDIRRDGISIESILNDLNARGARVKLLILDASRRNPYERRFRQAPAGLSTIDAPSGTLMVSAAAPGKATEDDDKSVFIGEMVKEMRTPGLTVEEIFSRTRIGVSRVTNGEQVPWMSSSLTDEFYLTQPSGRIGAAPSDSRPQRQPPATQAPATQAPATQPARQPPPQKEAATPPRVDSGSSGRRAGDVFRDCPELGPHSRQLAKRLPTSRPHQYDVLVPPRAAYSHSASLGRR